MSDPRQPSEAASVEEPTVESLGSSISFLPPLPGAPPRPEVVPEIPGYEIVGVLGRGGMGVVYLARQVALRRLVALKMIRHADLRPDDLARFRAEAEAAARLSHPNIVQIYEVGEHDGRPYLAMEYCPEGSLDARLRAQLMDAREAAQLVETLARAMQAAHAAQVIHRDLKPGNVLMASRVAPKITDFGLAKKLDDASLTQTGAILGTPSYMAPEQADGRTHAIGPSVDIYALGAILYECLTGRPPFRAPTSLETVLLVKTEEPASPRSLQRGVPRDLETITLKCLRKQPGQRYGSAGELADDLACYLAGDPIAARPSSWVERSVRWVKRHPATATAGGVGGLALVALLVGLSVGLVVVQRERDVARQERNKALQARARTRAALDEVSSEAIETLLTQQRELTDRHKAFLRRALELYAEFADNPDEDLTVRAEVAKAHGRMGSLRVKLGELPEAGTAFERAIDLYSALTRDDPGEPEHRAELGKMYDEYGYALYRRAKREDAERLFQRATEELTAVSEAHPETPGYRVSLANALVNLANIVADRRADEQAEAGYRRAIALFEGLPPATANEGFPRARQANARYNLALLLNDMGRPKEAEDEYKRAVAINEQLVKEFPDNHDWARRLSSCLINLSEVLANRGAYDEAEAMHRRGLDIQDKLVAQYPAIPEYRKFLGRTLGSLAVFLKDRKKDDAARAMYLRCIEVREQLVKQYPATPEYLRDLASIWNNYGFAEFESDRLKEAEAAYHKALAIQVPLVEKNPKIVEYRLEISNSYGNLGTVYLRRKAYADAEKAFRQTLLHNETLLSQHPNDAGFLLRKGADEGNVAEALAAHGQLEVALEWFTRSLDHLKTALARMKPPSAQGQEWLRNTLVMAARAAAKAGDGAKAVGWLKEAEAAGAFVDAKAVAKIKDDADLASLRSRADYQAWAQSLKPASK